VTRTVADQMVETLAAAGVERIYGIVGDSLNVFTDALRRHGGMQWLHVRHEEVAAFGGGAPGSNNPGGNGAAGTGNPKQKCRRSPRKSHQCFAGYNKRHDHWRRHRWWRGRSVRARTYWRYLALRLSQATRI
jgi:hypothetical protein